MISDLLHLHDLLPRTSQGLVLAVGQIASPAEVIDGDLPLSRLERAFASPHLSCVAVHREADGAVGLVTRSQFFAAEAGELGFGRALLSRALVADVTEWSPTVLDPEVGIVEAAIAVTARPDARRFDPVLVRARQWSVVSPADVVRALAGQLATARLRDEVTGLGNVTAAMVDLHRWSTRAAGTPHRVGLVLVRLEGVERLSGTGAETAVVVQAADHLRTTSPSGWEPARTGPAELALVGALPGPMDTAHAMAALVSVERAVAGFRPSAAAAVRWRSASVCSEPGGAPPQDLLAAARRRLTTAAEAPSTDAPPRPRQSSAADECAAARDLAAGQTYWAGSARNAFWQPLAQK